MLMLVLIHLDIYGGSVMSLLDASPAPVACRQSLPVSDAGQEEAVGGAYEEWADPDYRRQVLRHSHLCRPVFYLRTVLPALQEVPSRPVHFPPLQDTFSYTDSDVCLLHCLLII